VFHLEDLAGLARTIDAERAEALARELGREPERLPALLLATAFPPFTPRQGWQVDGLTRIARAGFRRPRSRRELETLLGSAFAEHRAPEARLAEFRRAVWIEKARIALRELLPTSLGGADIETSSLELSHLADAILELTLREAEAEAEERYGPPLRSDGSASELVVLGMGKLGGSELNAGSDIDLVFVYDTDDGESRVSLHEHWTRVTRRLVQVIDTPSEDGLIWRVDLRLRPEGSQGPLVNSVSAAERYYETWGRLWERSALLRARRSAGSVKLGQLIEREILTPFVFRHEVDPQIAVGLADLVQRSRLELSASAARDLKLGVGGIREAEFFVQSLQLIWGGQQPLVREKNTLEALSRLRNRGLVSDREARSTASAYVLLRKVEHRIQWMTGLQTHLLPLEGPELDRLARSLRLPRAEVLLGEIERAREDVHRVFQSLAPRTSPTTARPSRYAALVAALDAGRDELLRASEDIYRSADVVEHLLALGRRPDDLLGAVTRERYPALAERVLESIATSSDDEQAARYLRSFFARFPSPAPYVAALADDPIALRRLVSVLGASVFVGEALTARPDFADVVLFGSGGITNPSDAVESEIQAQLAALPEDAEPYERQEALVTGLRIAKRRVMVEVAAADLEGALGMREATLLLSLLADEELSRAAEFELGPGSSGLAVIALGKLGGREIGYGSDLDVLFIYDPSKAPNPEEAGAYFARKAQRIIHLVSEPNAAGPGYDLDTRLRPSGSQGMLVTSLESFARYHSVPLGGAEPGPGVQSSGAAWERQTLLRARFCAGDRALGERAIQVAERAAYGGGAPPVEEIRRLRARMEKELGRERADRYDLKSGRGGLLDVEFAVQWLQMVHGKDPMVRTTDTSDALEALYRQGYLGRAEYEAFREGYRFLRRLEQRIHVLRGAGSSSIDLRSRGLPHLARRMGYRDGPGERALDQLLERYRDVTNEVREAYDRVLT
jgi:glutamate-ammonia-ligase adenylyltransferase